MSPPTKSSTTPNARRKSSSKGTLVVTLKLSPKYLREFDESRVKKEDSPSKDSSSATSNTLPAGASPAADIPSESASNTPAPSGTPVPTAMPPPTEGIKKKGVKRSAGTALGSDLIPKVRGKPGPKKKARLEDGSIDPASLAPKVTGAGAAHKLGPKANQGAINAGLRALDRSGTPCRKWHRGSMKLKSFTGVIWEIPRWKAPAKSLIKLESESTASGESTKENKDSSQMESEKSNSGMDIEMTSNVDNNVNSPAPALAAADTPSVDSPGIVVDSPAPAITTSA
ncbi:INO80 complex, subunit Ies4 [Xylogone sp. PMI_703]|nr:INO80 complex, subunit Ies4 [Xylogone sp. PMI_703]